MEFILEMKDIVKEFPGVRALKGVSFQLKPGEVHALVGENGAGKSTLIKVLGGANLKDSGEVFLEGQKVEIQDPREAEKLGISIIYQEFNLIPFLSIAENIFLGREPKKGLFIDWPLLFCEAKKITGQLGLDLDLRAKVNTLSIAQQQMVEIAKAISVKAKIIVMDEPSATLTLHELERLFELTRRLKSQGVGIIYISHRLEELFEIADRVTILRDGQWVMTKDFKDVTKDELIREMVGRELKGDFPKRHTKQGEELLRVEGFKRKDILRDISFSLNRGEILGITGLVGARRTELVRAIFGADPIDAGKVYLEGKQVTINSPQDAIKLGISLATEDRKIQGLVLGMTVRENISIANLKSLSKVNFIDCNSEKEVAHKFVNQLKIKTPSIEQQTRNLSGGNQQKVVLAKWLFSKSKVVIFDEPTRGIDVGAKQEIYLLMNDLVESGVGIIMISSELPEVLGMSDRILIMQEGRLRAELKKSEATQEKIMHYATMIVESLAMDSLTVDLLMKKR